MRKTISIPMLIGPNGHWYAYGYGHNGEPGEVDEGFMLDNTEDWPGGEARVNRVDVQVDVDFPEVAPTKVVGRVVDARKEG